MTPIRKPRRVTRTGFALSPQASKHRTHFQMLVEDESGRELLFDVPSVRGFPGFFLSRPLPTHGVSLCFRWMIIRAFVARVSSCFPLHPLPESEHPRRSPSMFLSLLLVLQEQKIRAPFLSVSSKKNQARDDCVMCFCLQMPEYRQVRTGMRCAVVVLSRSSAFSELTGVTEAYLPELDLFVGRFPALDKR